MLAIKRCAQFNLYSKYRNVEIYTIIRLSDIQAAIRALRTHMTSTPSLFGIYGQSIGIEISRSGRVWKYCTDFQAEVHHAIRLCTEKICKVGLTGRNIFMLH